MNTPIPWHRELKQQVVSGDRDRVEFRTVPMPEGTLELEEDGRHQKQLQKGVNRAFSSTRVLRARSELHEISMGR